MVMTIVIMAIMVRTIIVRTTMAMANVVIVDEIQELYILFSLSRGGGYHFVHQARFNVLGQEVEKEELA